MKLKTQEHSKKIVSFIIEQYPDHKDDILLADGFDKAFLGIAEAFNGIQLQFIVQRNVLKS